MTKSEGQEKRISIRFPADVLVALRELARKHQRSLNGEVVWIVQEYIASQRKDEKKR